MDSLFRIFIFAVCNTKKCFFDFCFWKFFLSFSLFLVLLILLFFIYSLFFLLQLFLCLLLSFPSTVLPNAFPPFFPTTHCLFWVVNPKWFHQSRLCNHPNLEEYYIGTVLNIEKKMQVKKFQPFPSHFVVVVSGEYRLPLSLQSPFVKE